MAKDTFAAVDIFVQSLICTGLVTRFTCIQYAEILRKNLILKLLAIKFDNLDQSVFNSNVTVLSYYNRQVVKHCSSSLLTIFGSMFQWFQMKFCKVNISSSFESTLQCLACCSIHYVRKIFLLFSYRQTVIIRGCSGISFFLELLRSSYSQNLHSYPTTPSISVSCLF